MKRVIAIALLCAFGVVSAFIAGGALHPVSAATEQHWEYALLLYSASDGEVTWIQSDSDQKETMRAGLEGLVKGIDKTTVDYVNYLDFVGLFNWELTIQNVSNNGIVFTFKRPKNE